MKFEQALELMKEGKNMVRDSWPLAEGYLTFMPGMKHIWKILPHPNPNAGNHIFSVDEMDATDWALYQENKLVEEIVEDVVDGIEEPELMADAA